MNYPANPIFIENPKDLIDYDKLMFPNHSGSNLLRQPININELIVKANPHIDFEIKDKKLFMPNDIELNPISYWDLVWDYINSNNKISPITPIIPEE